MKLRSVMSIVVGALVLAGCSSNGKFFQNDGPPRVDRVSPVKHQVPKIEAFKPSTLRPYKVMGKTYTPMTGDLPYKQTGTASWYGKQFHNKKTATGEIYNMHELTAAHPTLPLPSYAKVTNLENHRSVIVRVNDRGPFLHNRIIDLSYQAAKELGYEKKGTAKVQVERLTFDDIRKLKNDYSNQSSLATNLKSLNETQSVKVNKAVLPSSATSAALTNKTTTVASYDNAGLQQTYPNKVQETKPVNQVSEAKEGTFVLEDQTFEEQTQAKSDVTTTMPAENVTPSVPVKQTQTQTPTGSALATGDYTVQLGFFSTYDNAAQYATHSEGVLASQGAPYACRITQVPKGYKVVLDIKTNDTEARTISKQINNLLGIQSFIVKGL